MMDGPNDRERVLELLRRLLANGALAHLPQREADLEVLVALAAARFEDGRSYREADVNEALRRWLATFCAPGGPDHVTLRRCLVDAGHLRRDKAGSAYVVARERLASIFVEDAWAVEPAAVLEAIRAERESRKRDREGGRPPTAV